MANNLLTKYIWLLETIQRYGRITRGEISELWATSPYGNGQKMRRRTFYNYREAIEELFGIRIGYNSSTFEYFIENKTGGTDLGDWLINSMSVNNMLTDAAGSGLSVPIWSKTCLLRDNFCRRLSTP